MSDEMKNLVILERGNWHPYQIVVHQIVERGDIKLDTGDQGVIKAAWLGVLAKNPKAFPGPTIRLAGRHHFDEKLFLEVLPSDYKEGSILSWIGMAMVPVTDDNYIVLQGPVASVVATIGGGIRVPGCTPEDTNVVIHIIKEMREEFNVDVDESNLTILGLVEVRPPIAKLHHGLVVKVKLPCTKKQLKEYWKDAEDKWEGELKFLKIRKSNAAVVLRDLGGYEAFNRQSLLILAMVVDSEIGTDYIERWSHRFGLW